MKPPLKKFCVVTLVGFVCSGGLVADDSGGDKPRNVERTKWRIEMDNDIVTGGDDAFSAGFSIQRYSPLYDTWDDKRRGKTRRGFARWVGRTVPGLGDDGEGGRVVRRATGVALVIQTPEDIENPDPQPFDVPWAGTIGLATSWASYDNRRLGAFQIFLGCMGPCSFAEDIQKFVHDDLGLSDDSPLGWDNQLENEFLGNVNYALRYKLAAPGKEKYAPGRFAGDLAIGTQFGAGNYFTFADAQAELRFGWGLPMGFTQIPDPAGRGMLIDPVYVEPGDDADVRRTRYYFSLVPRYAYFEEITTLEGGDTDNGGFHPGVDYDEGIFQVLFGFHIGRRNFALHFTYYYFPDDALDTPTDSSFDWANISLEWRF